jgi:hypothetical protein
MIRGEQVAKYLGARINPDGDLNGARCVYVKPGDLGEVSDGAHVDMVEEVGYIKMLAGRPGVRVIVLSESGRKYLKERMANEVSVIPQHHCNIEGIVRTSEEVTTVGVIGSVDSFDQPLDEFRKTMSEIGLNFVTCHSFRSREDVVDFYQGIDIQVSWNRRTYKQKLFRDSLRLKNAGSFGIPTVALPETNWSEFEGGYIRVDTMADLVSELKRLKTDRGYYEAWSQATRRKAEGFHISRIAELYRGLA